MSEWVEIFLLDVVTFSMWRVVEVWSSSQVARKCIVLGLSGCFFACLNYAALMHAGLFDRFNGLNG